LPGKKKQGGRERVLACHANFFNISNNKVSE